MHMHWRDQQGLMHIYQPAELRRAENSSNGKWNNILPAISNVLRQVPQSVDQHQCFHTYTYTDQHCNSCRILVSCSCVHVCKAPVTVFAH